MSERLNAAAVRCIPLILEGSNHESAGKQPRSGVPGEDTLDGPRLSRDCEQENPRAGRSSVVVWGIVGQ